MSMPIVSNSTVFFTRNADADCEQLIIRSALFLCSVGLEDAEDLIKDLEQALDKVVWCRIRTPAEKLSGQIETASFFFIFRWFFPLRLFIRFIFFTAAAM